MAISEATEMRLAEVLGDEKYHQFCAQRREVLMVTKTAGLHSAYWAMKNVEKTVQVIVEHLVEVEDKRDELLDERSEWRSR